MEDEFKLPEQPNQREPEEQFDQNDQINQIEGDEATEVVDQYSQAEVPEDINKIESIVEPEAENADQKIDVIQATSTQPVDIRTIEPDKITVPEPEKPEEPNKDIPLAQEDKKEKPAKKSFVKRILVVFIVIVLMLGSAALAYWWRDKEATVYEKTQAENAQSLQREVDSLNTNLAELTEANSNNIADSSTCPSVAPTDSIIENIKAAISTANTAALQGYLADNIDVTMINSQSASSSSSDGVILSLSNFLADSSLPWDFDLLDSVLATYKASDYGQYFEEATVIGKSANGKIVAITFDCNSKISKILLLTSEDSLK